MKKEYVTALTQNWHLIILSIGLIVAGIVFGFTKNSDNNKQRMTTITPGGIVDSSMAQAADKNFSTAFKVVPQQQKKARSAIQKYENENEAVGTGPEVEKNLYRIANIYYSILFDYEMSTFYYQKLINDYPETDKIQMAYLALADSYSKLEQFDKERSTYETIMEKFPKDSAAYKVAQEKYSINQ